MKRLDLLKCLVRRLSEDFESSPSAKSDSGLASRRIKEHLSIQNHQGMTPLHYAASKGSLEILRYLLDDLHVSSVVRNTLGQLPIHRAVVAGHLDCVSFLLDNNSASLYSTDKENNTLLHLAVECGHNDMIDLLRSRDSERRLDTMVNADNRTASQLANPIEG